MKVVRGKFSNKKALATRHFGSKLRLEIMGITRDQLFEQLLGATFQRFGNKKAIPPGEGILVIFPDKRDEKERLIQDRLDELNLNYGPGISRGDLIVFQVVYDSPQVR